LDAALDGASASFFAVNAVLPLPPLPQGLVLLCEVGSTAHGTGLRGHEDHDEMGIVVEVPQEVFGLGKGYGTHISRSRPEGVPSEPGDTDRTLYSLRRYLSLAAAGNPSILVCLFAPVLQGTALGRDLRANAQMFIGRHIVPRYRGYMQAQVEKLERGSGQREALVNAYGYDTKFAMHAARLGFQGAELLVTGRLALPMVGLAGDWLRAVRRGEIPFQEWRSMVRSLDANLALLADDGRYPERADQEAIERWSVQAHRASWGEEF
jgi:hypothetical protein